MQSMNDPLALQLDLDNANQWAIQNILPFNVDKCKVISLYKRNEFNYKLGNNVVLRDVQERDLGVIIQTDLGSSKQVDKAAKTAMLHVRLLRRAFGQLDESISTTMISAYIRPHIEYAVQAWSPWLKRDQHKLETPLRRATKLIKGYQHLTYELRLYNLGLFSEKYRRLRGDLILVYQILKYSNHPCHDLLEINNTTNLRGHSLKLKLNHCRLDCRKYSFRLRVCEMWNALPTAVVESPTLCLFKQNLDSALSLHHYIT